MVALCAAIVTACSSAGATLRPVAHHIHEKTCSPPVGGRCPGPEAVGDALISDLLLSKDGLTISGRFQCGGKLEVSEGPRRILLTYIASYVRQGGMACAMVPVSVHLDGPVGSRVVIDGVTGRRLHFGTRTGPLFTP